jgi:hypothetical protein
MTMFAANEMTVEPRALTIDELDQVSGGKKKAEYITVERCTEVKGKDGRTVQTCKLVSEQIL